MYLAETQTLTILGWLPISMSNKKVGKKGCEFGSCPGHSPKTGSNASDTRLNYVSGQPKFAMAQGIRVFGPAHWNSSAAELALSGVNVGSTLGAHTFFSGTVKAAAAAVRKFLVPAIAFSGRSGHKTAWNEATPHYSQVYSELALNITNTLVAAGKPYLPEMVFLNVNFPPVTAHCHSADQFKYVLTRIHGGTTNTFPVCNQKKFPTESEVMKKWGWDCFVSISPGRANWLKQNANQQAKQERVYKSLKPILSCLPNAKHG